MSVVLETDWAASDEFGPEKVLLLRDDIEGLEAIIVIDNTAAGPALGGLRMAPDLDVDEIARLARAMTLKNVAAGLPHGGAKGGIIGDPALPAGDKERLLRSFGRASSQITDYIPGPDMGFTEQHMAVLHKVTGRAIGLPESMGGIPLGALGTTGYGLVVATEAAAELGYVTITGARVVVQGFGDVGIHTARFFAERGASIIAVADRGGATVNADGLDLARLIAFKRSGNSVGRFGGGTPAEPEALIALDCDIWVPAARPDVFDGNNAGAVKARVVVQGANIPATAEAESIFHDRGVLVLPDFIANAGGVICGAVEYAGGTSREAFAAIEEKIRRNTSEVLVRAKATGSTPRQAANEMAHARLHHLMTQTPKHP